MTRATLQEIATLQRHGYTVERLSVEGGWLLLDADGATLMVADYGCVSPTQWEAVAEGLERIALNGEVIGR
jgi:hypothetical protein